MRIYLAGVGGMLGEAIHKVLAEKHELKCTDLDVNETWLERCDFRDFAEYERSVSAFDVTHNLAFGLMYRLPLGKGRSHLNRGGLVEPVKGQEKSLVQRK